VWSKSSFGFNATDRKRIVKGNLKGGSALLLFRLTRKITQPHHNKKARLAAGFYQGCELFLLHCIPIGINLVDLAQVQVADALFHFAHIAHHYPDNVVRLDELFGDGIG
jgi:hypothetical protein